MERLEHMSLVEVFMVVITGHRDSLLGRRKQKNYNVQLNFAESREVFAAGKIRTEGLLE